VLQHAPTLEVYHRPASVTAARVFSDPPMNLVDGVVTDGAPDGVPGDVPGEVPGKVIDLAGEIRVPIAGGGAGGHLAGLPAGPYCFGIRASDCRLDQAGAGDVAVRARVELSEISGSETFVYLRVAGSSSPFIVQHDGVVHYQLDDELTFYLDPDRLLAFGPAGDQLVMASYHAGRAANASR
jgi:glycerol transport system ATP-binding protein